MSWTIVIPVKRLDEAKSRLRPSVANVAGLALAFAVDTIGAAIGCERVAEVIVVTADPRVRSHAMGIGARVIDDPGSGLNSAASAGIALASGGVAVLTGDLPCLRAEDLDEALTLAEGHALAMVADHSGRGTTMLASADGTPPHPRFGIGSRARHEGAGHVVLDIPEASALRWDVDTAEDLAIALTLGVGPATAAAVSARAG